MSIAPERYILAIDLGTSGVKVACVSIHGVIAEHAFRELHTTILPGGGAEQNPEEWWMAVKEAVCG